MFHHALAAEEPAVDKAYASQMRLGLLVAGNAVHCAFAQGHRLLGLHQFTLQDQQTPTLHRQHLELLSREVSWLHWPFQKVIAATWNAPATLLPHRFAEVPLAEVGALMDDAPEKWIKGDGAFADYQIAYHREPGWHAWVSQSFDMATIQHPWEKLLPYWQQVSEHATCLQVLVHQNLVAIAVFQDGTLSLANTFRYTSEEDFLYFIMLVYKTLELSPEETPLYLSGHISKDGQLFSLLYKYIRHLHFAKWPELWEKPDFTNTLPDHLHIDLLSMLS